MQVLVRASAALDVADGPLQLGILRGENLSGVDGACFDAAYTYLIRKLRRAGFAVFRKDENTVVDRCRWHTQYCPGLGHVLYFGADWYFVRAESVGGLLNYMQKELCLHTGDCEVVDDGSVVAYRTAICIGEPMPCSSHLYGEGSHLVTVSDRQYAVNVCDDGDLVKHLAHVAGCHYGEIEDYGEGRYGYYL